MQLFCDYKVKVVCLIWFHVVLLPPSGGLQSCACAASLRTRARKTGLDDMDCNCL